MRRREVAQRKREAKALDEWKRETGQKRGRGKGSARLQREAERAQRKEEVRELQRERKRRARRKKPGQYARIPKDTPIVRRSTRKGISKSLLRVRGAGTSQRVIDLLNALPRGTTTVVQLGTGYGADAKWVGSKMTSPEDAAGWLEGIGLKYSNKIFKGAAEEDLFIEVLAYRRGSAVDMEELWEEAAELGLEPEDIEWEGDE